MDFKEFKLTGRKWQVCKSQIQSIAAKSAIICHLLHATCYTRWDLLETHQVPTYIDATLLVGANQVVQMAPPMSNRAVIAHNKAQTMAGHLIPSYLSSLV